MSDNSVTEYLENNPRMMGALFTILLLLTQAGNVAAANSGAHSGP